MSGSKKADLLWSLPACGALGAAVVLLPTLIWGNNAGAFFFLSIPLAIIIAVGLVAIALTKIRHHSLEAAAMLCIFLSAVILLYRSSDYLRTTTRWLILSQSYKRQVLNEPAPSDGSLKHVEWDGWGFAGAGNTTVYLVNDPSDRLHEAAKKGVPGKFGALPCEVVRVHRLESHWYTVLFYTDTDWTECAP